MVDRGVRGDPARDAWRSGRLAGLLRRCVQGAAALIEHYAREQRVAHDIRFLSSFDDRTLADIGLTRLDIEDAVRCRTDANRNARSAVNWSADALLPFPSIYDGRPERRAAARPARPTPVVGRCSDGSIDYVHCQRDVGRVRREAITWAVAAALTGGRRPPRPARSADRAASSRSAKT